MFRGQFIHKISKTGRISVPSKFRDNLKKKYRTNFLILSTFENSIICYPLPEWDKLEDKLSRLPQFKKETVEFERYLIGNAHECEIDTEGRIMIPSILRKDFNINNSAVFVGMLSRFEIWSEKVWKKSLVSSFKKFQKSREVIDEI
ncbi:division/cell wall cluster transcriptional repressor MraZ [bacterium]|jgi:MraZ protein|nr:division/cell wall cluster transcriptional repressor MraZ [bacterium]MBT3795052.1 division/cell wall cluster transcriptional repressor MraZ [bacterium]MBT4634428.1 division/cell wall cluster transcriptional repressor MraZ [bacterium]